METIAKYELREVLGRGGMGVVYRAYDPLMDREVALKIIQERALDVPELKARFVREARMAGKLSHDNIATVHDLGEADGKTFIVMEYLPGRNLRSIIDGRERLTLHERLDFAAQVCRGLHFAHKNGIVHRDIKPENIQVLPNRRIKIMDFGIAKPQIFTRSATSGTASEITLTSAGMRIGTPSYMSPEQVKGLPIDHRSDIFALGVLLYELFSYEKPFRGDDTTVLYKIVHEDPEPLRLNDSELNDLLHRVIMKCLAKDPGSRYDDCLGVLRDLQEARPRRAESDSGGTSEEVSPTNPFMLRMLPGSFVGQTVSHFRILEKIGDGGMGTVYKAEDLTLKRVVALKFLLSEGTLNPGAKERFFMEAQAASALDHPNICTIYEIGETGGGLFFICMSYCVGEDLGRILHSRNLDHREALDIGIKVARGLSKAHSHGIIHRDIKPANIIVSPSGEVKVVDFGLAKLSGGTQFTRMASVMGTLPYMSPEQIKGGDVDPRTDIWSLGIVLYQTLTGRLPFEGNYEAALFYAILNETPPPPSSLKPALPPLLDAVIARALSKKADERYASMDELLTDMERVSTETSGVLVSDIGSPPEVTTLLENGKTYLERRKFEEALSRFEAALRLMPGHTEAETLRIRSVQELAQARELDTRVQEAESLLDRGRTKEARDLLFDVAARDPRHSHASELLTRAEKTLEREEQLAKLLVDADFYMRRGKFAEARERFQQALALAPEHRDALRGLKRTERQQIHQTNRTLKKTPLPMRSRNRLLMPAALLLIAVAGGLSWYLLKPETSAVESESVTSTLPSTPAHPDLQQQNGRTTAAPKESDHAASASPVPPSEELRRNVPWAEKEMLVEKRRADKKTSTGGQKSDYSDAARKEEDGNRAAQSGTNVGLESQKIPPPGVLTKSDRSTTPANSTADIGSTNIAVPPPPTPATSRGAEVDHQPTSGLKLAEKPRDAAAENAAALESSARLEINKMLQEYRESIEHGDVKRLSILLSLSDQAESNWSTFFSSSESRKVSIEGVHMDINQGNARVTFKTKMSFFNNQTNAPQDSENPRQWTLESENGAWKIVNQK
jgi:serine/threonine protein kinase